VLQPNNIRFLLSSSSARRVLVCSWIFLSLIAPTSTVNADDSDPPPPLIRPTEPRDITGQLSEESDTGDTRRTLADVFLFVPRKTLELFFFTTGTAAGFFEDKQVVPRVKDWVYTKDHRIGVFPTAFVETGFTPNIGARMISSVDQFATTLRAGYGGPHNYLVESRMTVGFPTKFPLVFGIEGVGPDPQNDPRNKFLPTAQLRAGLYRDVRQRLITTLGARPETHTEVLLSFSYKHRNVQDAPDAGEAALTQVFEPASISNSFRTRRTYSELAYRYDNRATRGPPATGTLMEAYAGVSSGILEREQVYTTFGGRVIGYLAVYRKSNILAPKVAIDTIVPVPGSEIAFTELRYQPEYRGIDGRRDRIALLASLDYRWELMKFVGAHVFADTTTVAADLQSIDLKYLRYAFGFGVDLHSSTTQVSRVSMAFSPEGFRFLFNFGVAPSGFGDRQHTY
jgi:hypothetical protein